MNFKTSLDENMIRNCRTIAELKECVSIQLAKRKLRTDWNWELLRIEQMDKDPELSKWLEKAIYQFKALKKRSRLRVILS